MNKPIEQTIGSIALVIKNYDDAIAFYTQKLQFELIEDTDLGDGKRWVLISPPNASSTKLLLAQASNEEQALADHYKIEKQVFLFLHTNDFWRDYHLMQANGIEFTEEPRVEEYGTVVVFKDLYGTKWDLLQLTETSV